MRRSNTCPTAISASSPRSRLSGRAGMDGRRLGHPRRDLRQEGDAGRAGRQQDRDRQGRRRAERRRDRARRRALCLQQRRRRLSRRLRAFCRPGPAPDYKGGSIQRIDPKTGETRVLYSECNGHKLSAPNDIVFDSEGGFYFTDLGKRYANQRDHGGLYYALPDGSKSRRAGLPDADPERGRAVAG